jgi:O-antigen/teichoic acid export membrane protein
MRSEMGVGMPDARHRVLRNTTWLLAGEVVSRLLAAGYQVLLARYLGTALFGEFTLAMALAAILGIVSDLGLTSLTVREVSRAREAPMRVAAPAMRARAFLAVLLGGVAVAASAGAGRTGRATALLAILAGTQLVQGQAEILAAAHRGRERFGFPVAASLACRTGLVASGVLAAALGASVSVFALLTTLWTLPLLAVLPRGLPRLPGPGRRPGELLRMAAPIGIGAALWALYFRLDLILLATLRGEEAVGIYGAAFRLFEASLLLQGPLLAAALPVLSRGGEEAGGVFRLVIRILALVAVPLAALFLTEGEEVLGLLFGEGYREAGEALAILGLSLPVSFLAAPFLTLLIAGDRERVYAKIMLAATLVKPLFGLWLIRRFGLPGAAGATLATEIAVLALLVLCGEGIRGLMTLELRVLGAGASMALFLLAGREAGIPFAIRLGLGILVVYPAAALALRALRRGDLALLRLALGRRKG